MLLNLHFSHWERFWSLRVYSSVQFICIVLFTLHIISKAALQRTNPSEQACRQRRGKNPHEIHPVISGVSKHLREGCFLQVIPHLSLIKHSVISSDEEQWLAEGKPVELLFGANDLYIHYIDKSIGTPSLEQKNALPNLWQQRWEHNSCI